MPSPFGRLVRWLRLCRFTSLVSERRSRPLSIAQRLRRGLGVEALEARWLPAVSQLAFLTAPQTLTTGGHSGLITIQLEDPSGNAATAASTITFQLSTNSTAGSFLDNNGNSLAGSSVTIPAGSSSVGFEYLDLNLGNPTLTVSGGGLLATQQETVITPSALLNSLYSFNSNGFSPQGNLIADSSGNLFGTTNSGGTYNVGAVFELARGSNTITTLASFNPNTDGIDPETSLVLDSNGNIFGTTLNSRAYIGPSGGTNGYGTIFELMHGSSTITTLANFTVLNGGVHEALYLDHSGTLFGTTSIGVAHGDGTVFELAQGSNTITTLASFNGGNGSNPEAGLTEDSNGNFFGTTSGGGANSDGTVFELAQGSSTITTLASFNGADGVNPQARLMLDSGGDLFGTTSGGGPGGGGTVFELAQSSSTITTLASFNGANGADPI